MESTVAGDAKHRNNKQMASLPFIAVTEDATEFVHVNNNNPSFMKIVAIGNPAYFNKSEKWNSLICELLSQFYVICPSEQFLENGYSIENLIINSDVALFLMTEYSVQDSFSLKMLQKALECNIAVVSVRDPTFELPFSGRFDKFKEGRTKFRNNQFLNSQAGHMIPNPDVLPLLDTSRGKEKHRRLSSYKSCSNSIPQAIDLFELLSLEFRNAIVYCTSAKATMHLILRRIFEINQNVKKQTFQNNSYSISTHKDIDPMKDENTFLSVPSFLGMNHVTDSGDEDMVHCKTSKQMSKHDASLADIERIKALTNDSDSYQSIEEALSVEFDDTCYLVFPDKQERGENVTPKLIRWPHKVELKEELKSESSGGFQDIDLSILLSTSTSLSEKFSDEESEVFE